ncbi:hypothetical protein [Aquimarina algiphila]|uniref:hypothetical protein n=1 Tax=Aquimarina algiphila TaxID=2047982 RepID=UPI00232B070E|nr:hypothetical protein [Aquimarina algiphila]
MTKKKEHSIQNGKYKIIIEQHEMRMSHLVNGFAIVNTATKSHVINLLNSIWDLVSFEEEGEKIILQCRKYPYGIPYTLKIIFSKRILYVNGVKHKIEYHKELLK